MRKRRDPAQFDHVVTVTFENRSFDNLLGRLYQPGEVAAFEGAVGNDLSNPIPERAKFGADRGFVPYTVARNMDVSEPRLRRRPWPRQYAGVRRGRAAPNPRRRVG